jgi:hypothetical protein
MTRMKRDFTEYGLMLLLAAAVLILFLEPLISERSLCGGDFLFYFYPLKKFIRDHFLANGSLPFWNSYQFSGTPMISNIQASMFYPLGILYYLFPPEVAYGYSTILHCVLGSIFMFAFMRNISVSPAGSFVAALVFSFNGYFMGHLYAGHLTFVQTYIWIPLVFLFLNRFAQSRSLGTALIAGLVLGIHILGGFPQVAFYTSLASTLFVLYHAFIHRHNRAHGMWKLGTGFLICLLVGFCLAAIQVLPTLEFSRLSTRGEGISYSMATYESLHPKELLAFLIPEIYGNPVDGTYWRSREFHHFWESCGYLGILPLLLVLVKGKRSESRNIRVFFILLAFLALFLALGKYNPVYPLIYRLPGFNSFRIPAQIIFLYVFSVAVLSGIGLSKITEGEWTLGRGYVLFLLMTGGALALATVGLHLFPFKFFFFLFGSFAEGPVTHANLSLLLGRMSRSVDKAALLLALCFFVLFMGKRLKLRASLLAAAACAIVSVDLFLFGSQFVRTCDLVTTPEKKHIVDQLTRNPAEGRVLTHDPLFGTNDGLQYRFPSVLGYDPLILKRYVEFVLAGQDLPPNDHVVNLYEIGDPKAKLPRLLNVRQFVSDGQTRNVENSIPYAFLVEEAVAKEPDEILPYMKSDAFDPGKAVVLERRLSPVKEMEVPVEESLKASCQVVSYAHEEIRLKASSNRPGYLVVSELFYPGWYASVDGHQTPIWRGNFLFRVIPLDSGDHEIRFYFISWPFRVGAVLSLLSLCPVLGFLVRRKVLNGSSCEAGIQSKPKGSKASEESRRLQF